MLVDLALFKAHIRASDFADEDDYLRQLLAAAEEAVIHATNRTEAELLSFGGGKLPAGLAQAVMLLAAHWYNQRESAASAQMYAVPHAFHSLVMPYRKFVDDADAE